LINLKIRCEGCGDSIVIPLSTKPIIVPEETPPKFSHTVFHALCNSCYEKWVKDIDQALRERCALQVENVQLRKQLGECGKVCPSCRHFQFNLESSWLCLYLGEPILEFPATCSSYNKED
jgi:hypothetical protein